VVAYPSVTFLGLVPYHSLDFVVSAPVVPRAGCGRTAAVGAARTHRALCGLLWSLQVIDIVTGGRLQINTPLGYTPTIAGRFQGYGNLSFGLVAASSIVVAVLGAWLVPARKRLIVCWAAWVGAITLVADAAPRFGSDVGGTLAILPGWGAAHRAGRSSPQPAAVALAGRRRCSMTCSRAGSARPASSRTHLGRFADDLLHGDGAW
jgi:hypothetical protein